MSVEVSVVIPVKNENDPYIDQCLASLRQMNYSNTFEIIVVKGGNRAQARNFGVKLAKGEIIAFIDSDCMAPKHWLATLVKYLISCPELGGVGGPNLSPLDDSLTGKAIDQVFHSYLGSLGKASLYRPTNPKFTDGLACVNSVFWRKVLVTIGGFDEEFELNEDTNLSHKIKKAGYELMFVPDPFVWHRRRNSIKHFVNQFFSYGIGRMRSILTSRDYADTKIIVPFLGGFLFPIILWFFPLLALIISTLYLLVVFFLGLQAAYENKERRFLLLVPVLLVTEHFSYLLGMICGITKGKWKRKEESCEVYYSSVIAE